MRALRRGYALALALALGTTACGGAKTPAGSGPPPDTGSAPTVGTSGPEAAAPASPQAAKEYEAQKVNVTKLWKSVVDKVTAAAPTNEDQAFEAAAALADLEWSAFFYPDHNKADVDAQRAKYLAAYEKWPAKVRAMTMAMLWEYLHNSRHFEVAKAHHLARMDYLGHTLYGRLDAFARAQFFGIAGPYCRSLQSVAATELDPTYGLTNDYCRTMVSPDERARQLLTEGRDVLLQQAESSLAANDVWGAVRWSTLASHAISEALQLRPMLPGVKEAMERVHTFGLEVDRRVASQPGATLPEDSMAMAQIKQKIRDALVRDLGKADELRKEPSDVRTGEDWTSLDAIKNRRWVWAWFQYPGQGGACDSRLLGFEQLTASGTSWTPSFIAEAVRTTGACSQAAADSGPSASGDPTSAGPARPTPDKPAPAPSLVTLALQNKCSAQSEFCVEGASNTQGYLFPNQTQRARVYPGSKVRHRKGGICTGSPIYTVTESPEQSVVMCP